MCRAFHPGDSTSQPPAVSVSLTGILALEDARAIYRLSAHLDMAEVPPCTCTLWPQVATWNECKRISTYWFQPSFTPRRGFIWWASICFILMYLLYSHSGLNQDCAHTGMPLIIQFFIAHMPDHMARSSVTTHKSVYTQTLGLLFLFKSSITLGKMTCSLARRVDS